MDTANHRPEPIALRHLLLDAFSVLQARQERPEITGLSTGFRQFDEMTAGLQPGELFVLAGRPAMGKSTLAMNMAMHAALAGKTAAVFSMELSTSQFALRMLSSLGRVHATRLRTGMLEDEDWQRVSDAIRRSRDARIFIDETPAISPDDLCIAARGLKRHHDIDLIVVDCLQRMALPTGVSSYSEGITESVRSLKALAVELGIPILMLSQLNRALEHRRDKRPMLADLHGSGVIEQVADVIAFVYRNEYYFHVRNDQLGLAEVIIAKQRNGPTGSFILRFVTEFARFENRFAID